MFLCFLITFFLITRLKTAIKDFKELDVENVSCLSCVLVLSCLRTGFIGGGDNDSFVFRFIMISWLTFPQVQLPIRHCQKR